LSSYRIVKERLFWSYANLAMAHSAVEKGQDQYTSFNFMIRSRLYKGLMDGSMSVRSIFDDEKLKILSGDRCAYCGVRNDLVLDHLFAKGMGGDDSGDNLVHACRSCNSSKGKKDLMEWMVRRNAFPPLMILRRYLKLAIFYCSEKRLMEKSISDVQTMRLPFRIEYVPIDYPAPKSLSLFP